MQVFQSPVSPLICFNSMQLIIAYKVCRFYIIVGYGYNIKIICMRIVNVKNEVLFPYDAIKAIQGRLFNLKNKEP